MEAWTFLAETQPLRTVRSLYVLAGPERFLKRLVLEHLLRRLTSGQEQDWLRSIYTGESERLAEVLSEVQTPAMWGGRRLVVVDDADPFISRYRETLEKLAGRPLAGVLVLLVEKWASNTRLAKALPGDAVITCDAPKPRQLITWCQNRAHRQHGKKITPDGAQLLVELTGGEVGVLEQELHKLASYVGENDVITVEDVDRLVARNRVQTVWQILEALGRGDAAQALVILERLLEQGEEPLAILGALSWQLRKVAQLARLVACGMSEHQAALRIGLSAWQRERTLALVGQFGQRALQLYDWLLHADIQLKTSATSPRLVLETLLVRLLLRENPVQGWPTARS
ncbi:MAG: DNA polymerase III subunit delta [Gemmatales bacterium]|nr:DNA polymerase III subunit delta [Gemmatales bacterium]